MKKILTIGSTFIALAMMLAMTASAAIHVTPVSLGSAGNFVILSKAGITDVPASKITGNIGASPITGAAIGVTCSEVTGKIYSVDAAGPMPCRITNATLLGTAVNDMQTAYTNAAGRPAGVGTFLNRGAGNIGGLTLAPGIYTWGTAVTIPTNLTLRGSATDIWIFQIAGTLNIASAKKVILQGGARASNIFWQVSGATTLGTGSTFNGTILDKTNIAIQTGATLNGRALAQTAVTLDHSTVK